MPISVFLLIFSNLVPLIGAVFFHWDMSSIIFLYWLESSVIGLFNVAKMITIIHHNPNQRFTPDPNFSVTLPAWPFGYGRVLFFLFHFGISMLVHGFFLTFSGLIKFINLNTVSSIIVAYFSMIISHGVSFYTNFISKKEYLRTSLTRQMFQPYGRVTVMHFTILFAAFPFINNTSIVPVILLVVMKTIVDLFSHLKEHSGLSLAKQMTSQQLGQTITQMKAAGKTNEEITQFLMNKTVK